MKSSGVPDGLASFARCLRYSTQSRACACLPLHAGSADTGWPGIIEHACNLRSTRSHDTNEVWDGRRPPSSTYCILFRE